MTSTKSGGDLGVPTAIFELKQGQGAGILRFQQRCHSTLLLAGRAFDVIHYHSRCFEVRDLPRAACGGRERAGHNHRVHPALQLKRIVIMKMPLISHTFPGSLWGNYCANMRQVSRVLFRVSPVFHPAGALRPRWLCTINTNGSVGPAQGEFVDPRIRILQSALKAVPTQG